LLECPECDQRILIRIAEEGVIQKQPSEPPIFDGTYAESIYPISRKGPIPAIDMPEDIKKDFEEARLVAQFSPRAAAALLRLALQKLCEQLSGQKGDINKSIKKLVENGLSSRLQKAFEIVRIAGNNAVHPGELNLDDDPKIVGTLWGLINMIVEKMITEQKEIDAIYDKMPEGAKTAIEKRDGKPLI